MPWSTTALLTKVGGWKGALIGGVLMLSGGFVGAVVTAVGLAPRISALETKVDRLQILETRVHVMLVLMCEHERRTVGASREVQTLVARECANVQLLPPSPEIVR